MPILGQPPNRLKVLLVIPLYNHAATVADVAQKALLTGYPLLVVDDGSTDDGFSRVEKLGCFKLKLAQNGGKGVAILAAARFAAKHGFEAILTIDADGQHDPDDAAKLIAKVGKNQWPAIIIGSRRMIQATVPRSSIFGRKFSNFWVRLESGLDLEDTQSGMRLYPLRELLLLNLTRHRYDFEIEVLVKAIWAGVAAGSVDIAVHYPPPDERVSHFDKIVDNWRLTRVHSALLFRRLLPFPHKQLVEKKESEEKALIVKNPWQTLRNFCRESSSPFWLAVAVWLGIFLGALPLIACHTIVIIYVSFRFHLNKVAAVAASQFCMPPVVPVLCIEVGYYLRTGHLLLDLSWERWLSEIHHRLWDWLLGSLIVGPILGLIGATFVYLVARKFEARAMKEVS